MKTFARTILLRDEPGVADTYRHHHAEPFPEVVAALRAIGVLQMRIWLRGRTLFMLMETVDDFEPGRDFARYEATGGRVAEWEALMRTMQEPVSDAAPGEWWAEMEQVFDTRTALRHARVKAMEEVHRRGYATFPVEPGEFDSGSADDPWGDL